MVRPWRSAMAPRDPSETHRASTNLELFFDLCFVVAVAQASTQLHHAIGEGHFATAAAGFPLAFFTVWWCWLNFTWFASAYDTDDGPYRLAVFVQILGALVIAAGIPKAFETGDFTVPTAGYTIMRLALVGLWLRARFAHTGGRGACTRYAVGISVCQVGWWLALTVDGHPAANASLIVAEMLVPVWAERSSRTSWHPGHIVERYGLFTIIVLGESILAATLAIQNAIGEDNGVETLWPVIVGGLLIVFSMWWMYFDQPARELVGDVRERFGESLLGGFAWGYGHYFVFASAAAVGAGLAVAVDHRTGHGHISSAAAGLAITAPVAVFVLAVWALHASAKPRGVMRIVAAPITAALVLASSVLEQAVLVTGVLLVAHIAAWLVAHGRAAAARTDAALP